MLINYGKMSASLENKILRESFVPGNDAELCCICGEPIEGYGNNAAPLADGRCCDACNMQVIKARMQMLNDIINTPDEEVELEVEEEIPMVTESLEEIPVNKPAKKMASSEKLYRKLAHLEEDFEITEENINPWALGRTAVTKNRPEAFIKNEILHKEI